MTKPNFPATTFLTSVAELEQLPTDFGNEVAFAGRSNAGKSTAINAITNNQKLTKTGKTPGRTQLINFFTITPQQRLVDLPGYGYAQVPLAIKHRWQKTLSAYLETRTSLRGLILVMDIRHPLKEFDQQMILWATLSNLPLHILLTKADKLTAQHAKQTLQQVHKHISKHPNCTVQLFSAPNKLGLDEARKQILNWLQ